jgi:acetyl esterase/lipase
MVGRTYLFTHSSEPLRRNPSAAQLFDDKGKPLFLPLMKQAGIEVEYRESPDYGHGFYFGRGADLAVVEQAVTEVRTFLQRTMPSPGHSGRLPDLDRHRLWAVREAAFFGET